MEGKVDHGFISYRDVFRGDADSAAGRSSASSFALIAKSAHKGKPTSCEVVQEWLRLHTGQSCLLASRAQASPPAPGLLSTELSRISKVHFGTF